MSEDMLSIPYNNFVKFNFNFLGIIDKTLIDARISLLYSLKAKHIIITRQQQRFTYITWSDAMTTNHYQK